MKKGIICLIVISLVSGCVGIPKTQKNTIKTVVNTKENKQDNIIFTSERWWENNKDENLKEMIELTLKNNSQIKIAKLNIEKAKEYYGASKTANLSTVAITGGYTRDHLKGTETITALDIGDIKHSDTLDIGNIGISAGYEIDFWGKFQSIRKEAEYSLLAVELENKWINIVMSTKIAELYAKYILVINEIKLLKEKEKIAKEMAGIGRESYEVGFGTKEQYLVSLNNFNLAKENMNKLKMEKEIIENSFGALIGGVEIEKLNEILIKIEKNQNNFKNLINAPKSIDSDIIINRPDVKYYLALLESKREVLNSAKADFYPRFTILGKYQYIDIDVENLLEGNSNLLTLGASLYLPLFNRSQLKRKVKVAGVDLNIFIENYNENLVKAYEEVNNSLLTLKTSKNNNFLGNKGLKNSEIIYSQDKELYKIGSISRVEFLIRENKFIDAKINQMKNNFIYYNSQIAMIKTLGGYYKEEVKN